MPAPRIHGLLLLRLIGLAVLVLLLAWQVLSWRDLSASGVLARMDAVLYDWRFQLLTPARKAPLPIVIVDLDEYTQQREGRWPWDRAKVAELVHALRSHGAQLIGFDVVFSEAVENPVGRILREGDLPPDQRQALIDLQQRFDGDQILAQSLDSMIVLGFFLHADGMSSGQLPPPLLTMSQEDVAISTIRAMPDYTASLPVLADSGASAGFVVAIPDADGIMRRVPLIMRHQQDVYVSLTLEMARLALNAPWIQLQQVQRRGREVVTAVRLGRMLEIPLDETGSMLVPYKGGAGSYPTVSATSVLRGDAHAHELAWLQGSVVLVGTSALGLSDLRSMPLQTGYPGVEAHANVLDALLQAALGQNTLYLQPDWAPGAVLIFMLLVGLLLALWLPGRSPRITLLACLLVLFLMLAGNAALWHFAQLSLSLAAPLLMLALLSLLNIASGHIMANRQRHAIQALFGEYVPPAHVERMIARPELMDGVGEQREMTVLFADVRNFTATSEHLSAAALKEMLNRYLGAVTEVIFDHQGTIDKYVGDMVMAFWNAPLDDPDHASHAVHAALAMQRRLVALRAEFAAENLPQLHMGIGLNAGQMNVGDMGSRYRRAYTVLGDAVNLGARLESLTSFYRLPILVSDAVQQQAPDILYRLIDRVQVKGRESVLDIYQPLLPFAAPEDSPDHAAQLASARRQADAFEQAVQNYRKRQWHSARQGFHAIASQWPDDTHLCELYLARMQGDPAALPDGWDGTYSHVSK